jgi:hypothetical protein
MNEWKLCFNLTRKLIIVCVAAASVIVLVYLWKPVGYREPWHYFYEMQSRDEPLRPSAMSRAEHEQYIRERKEKAEERRKLVDELSQEGYFPVYRNAVGYSTLAVLILTGVAVFTVLYVPKKRLTGK